MRRPCAGVRLPAKIAPPVRPTADEIARRAFELYERRCTIDGWDLDDAADADGELIQERVGQLSRTGA